jgi:hypothetical protein
MRFTGFSPRRHGFRFVNSFVNRIVGGISTEGLCGGMCLAAARYYKRGRPIPTQTSLPRENSVLRNYIFGCQMESYGPLGPLSAANWITMPWVNFDEQFRWCLGEFNRLKPMIDNDEPVVIGLRTRQQGNPVGHQVLAIGYDEPPRRVYLYDPNYPNETEMFTLDESRRRLVYARQNGGGVFDNMWAAFFITGCSIGNQLPPEIRAVQ